MLCLTVPTRCVGTVRHNVRRRRVCVRPADAQQPRLIHLRTLVPRKSRTRRGRRRGPTPTTHNVASKSSYPSNPVTGVTCSTDLTMIKASVEKVQGVSACKTVKQGATTSFEIKYNPRLSTEKAINAAIEGTSSCENPDERPYKIKRKKVKQKS